MPSNIELASRMDRRDLEPGRHEAREIFVHAGRVVVRARLLATPAADLIWAALPIYSSVELPGGLGRLDAATSVAARGLPQSHASSPLAHGELAIVTDTHRTMICVGGNRRIPSAKALTSARTLPEKSFYVFARAFDSVSPLLDLEQGRAIALLEAAS